MNVNQLFHEHKLSARELQRDPLVQRKQ